MSKTCIFYNLCYNIELGGQKFMNNPIIQVYQNYNEAKTEQDISESIELINNTKGVKSYLSIAKQPIFNKRNFKYRIKTKNYSKFMLLDFNEEKNITNFMLKIDNYQNNKVNGYYEIKYQEQDIPGIDTFGIMDIIYTNKKGVKTTIAHEMIKNAPVTLDNINDILSNCKNIISNYAQKEFSDSLFSINDILSNLLIIKIEKEHLSDSFTNIIDEVIAPFNEKNRSI